MKLTRIAPVVTYALEGFTEDDIHTLEQTNEYMKGIKFEHLHGREKKLCGLLQRIVDAAAEDRYDPHHRELLKMHPCG